MKKRQYLPYFDGLRTIGFFIVFIAHIGQKYKDFYIAGKSAVVIFFIISSFLFMIHLLQNIDFMNNLRHWAEYIIKRILRLYPIYILVLVVELITASYTIEKFLSHLLMIDARKHYWTIPVLIQFYLLIPFFVLLVKKTNEKRILLTISILLTLLILLGIFYTPITSIFLRQTASQSNIIFYLPSFIIGIITSLIYLYIKKKEIIFYNPLLLSTATVATIIFICLLPFSYKMFASSSFGNEIFMPLVIFTSLWSIIILCLLLVKKGVVFDLFENNLIRYLGKISYNAYLIHIIIINIVYYFVPENIIMGAVCAYILTISLSALSYEYINKPIENYWKKK